MIGHQHWNESSPPSGRKKAFNHLFQRWVGAAGRGGIKINSLVTKPRRQICRHREKSLASLEPSKPRTQQKRGGGGGGRRYSFTTRWDFWGFRISWQRFLFGVTPVGRLPAARGLGLPGQRERVGSYLYGRTVLKMKKKRGSVYCVHQSGGLFYERWMAKHFVGLWLFLNDMKIEERKGLDRRWTCRVQCWVEISLVDL